MTSIKFTSPEIKNYDIPSKFTCDGENINPSFKWQVDNDSIESFAIIIDDPDAIPVVGFVFTHFAIVNIPSYFRELEENINLDMLEDLGALILKNDHGTFEWFGPCPPPGRAHTYHFALYALNTTISLHDTTKLTMEVFENQFKNNILGKSVFLASYQRK